ncbi:MAG: phosphotransferase [Actinoallomurus sp.]
MRNSCVPWCASSIRTSRGSKSVRWTVDGTTSSGGSGTSWPCAFRVRSGRRAFCSTSTDGCRSWPPAFPSRWARARGRRVGGLPPSASPARTRRGARQSEPWSSAQRTDARFRHALPDHRRRPRHLGRGGLGARVGGPRVWLHGDLHPANVVADGTLAGVVDFGELCAGDPATDLAAAWVLLPAGAAPRFLSAYANTDEAMIRRARGWAVLRGMGLISIGRAGDLGLPGGKPTWGPAGRSTIENVLASSWGGRLSFPRDGTLWPWAEGRQHARTWHGRR